MRNEITTEDGANAMLEVMTRQGNISQQRIHEFVNNAISMVGQGRQTAGQVFGGYVQERNRMRAQDAAVQHSAGSSYSSDQSLGSPPPAGPSLTRSQRF